MKLEQILLKLKSDKCLDGGGSHNEEGHILADDLLLEALKNFSQKLPNDKIIIEQIIKAYNNVYKDYSY